MNSEPAHHRTKRPGDILRLPMDLRAIPAGGYVLLSIEDECCLAALGETAEGKLCATSTQVRVPIADLSLFLETGLSVEPF